MGVGEEGADPNETAGQQPASGGAAAESKAGQERGPGWAQPADRLEPTEEALTPFIELRITLLRNIRYHEDREGFFTLWNRILTAFVLLSGTAVFVAAVHADSPSATTQAIAIGTTLIGVVQLVFDLPRKQFLHESLRVRFLELHSEATASNVEITKVAAARLYGQEPPTYYAVDALAFNAAMQSLGRNPAYARRVNLLQRRLRHRLRFANARFPERGATDARDGWFRRWLLG